jgi:hypothetical protein
VETALTGVGGFLFNLAGVAIDVVFGFVGGLIGGAIFGTRRPAAYASRDSKPVFHRKTGLGSGRDRVR